jgi:hypothetical protein
MNEHSLYSCVKYHSETHLKNEYTLNKMKDTKAKQVLFGG